MTTPTKLPFVAKAAEIIVHRVVDFFMDFSWKDEAQKEIKTIQSASRTEKICCDRRCQNMKNLFLLVIVNANFICRFKEKKLVNISFQYSFLQHRSEIRSVYLCRLLWRVLWWKLLHIKIISSDYIRRRLTIEKLNNWWVWCFASWSARVIWAVAFLNWWNYSRPSLMNILRNDQFQNLSLALTNKAESFSYIFLQDKSVSLHQHSLSIECKANKSDSHTFHVHQWKKVFVDA